MENKKVLNAAWLLLTNQCNLKCKYCWVTKYGNRNKIETMSKEVIDKSLDFLHENAEEGVSITLFGGEPLLEYDSIKYIMDKYPSLNYVIYTNATLLDNKKLEFFYNKRDFIKIILSIDGTQEAQMKGRGCFYNEDIVSNIFKSFSTSEARMTLYDASTCYDGVKKLYTLGAKKIEVNVPYFIKLDENYYNTLSSEREKIHREYCLNSITRISDHTIESVCNASEDYVAIAPNGDIYPCDIFYWLNKDKIGNIYDGINREFKCSFLERSKIKTDRESTCIAERMYYCET